MFSRNNLPRIKNGACVINLDYKNSKGTHWVSLFIDSNKAVYLYSFEVLILKEVLNKIRGKSTTRSIIRIQDNESIKCEFYCTAFIEYMLAGKILLYNTNTVIYYIFIYYTVIYFTVIY